MSDMDDAIWDARVAINKATTMVLMSGGGKDEELAVMEEAISQVAEQHGLDVDVLLDALIEVAK